MNVYAWILIGIMGPIIILIIYLMIKFPNDGMRAHRPNYPKNKCKK
jgi:hypothetical protein